ncbi:MAG: hypothetical protein JST20_04840 [Bacteroidetes bacterium]|nr:hypothetical protein [Bacteroidota bacterium]
MKNIFYILSIFFICISLMSCNEDISSNSSSNSSAELQYNFGGATEYKFIDSGKSYIVTIKRKELPDNEFEEIYIDPNYYDGMYCDTFYYKTRQDTLFGLVTYDVRGKTYKVSDGLGYRYVPIFVPAVFEKNFLSHKSDSALRMYFQIQDKKGKSQLINTMYKDYYKNIESVLWGTSRIRNKYNLKKGTMDLDGYPRIFPEERGGCERITNFTYRGVNFDTVLKCTTQFPSVMDLMCTKIEFYTKNYLLIVDSMCNKEYITPLPESLIKIHELSK